MTRQRGADRGKEHQAEGATRAKPAAERPPAGGERGVVGADPQPAAGARPEAWWGPRRPHALVEGLWLLLCRTGIRLGFRAEQGRYPSAKGSLAYRCKSVVTQPQSLLSTRDRVLLFNSFVFFEGCTMVYYF